MWGEVFIDDDIYLQEYIDIWNGREDCVFTFTVEDIKNIMTKRDAHCYMFRGIYIKILIMYRYDDVDDVISVFQLSSNKVYENEKDNTPLVEETWNAHIELWKSLIERYNKKIKVRKKHISQRTSDYDIKVLAIIIDRCAQDGLKATDFNTHWIYELM